MSRSPVMAQHRTRQHPAAEAKKDPSKTPYVCLACAVGVWGKPDLNLLCMDCDQPMKPDDAGAWVTPGPRPLLAWGFAGLGSSPCVTTVRLRR